MSNALVRVTEGEYKEQLVRLLERIHRVCCEHNLRYTIAFGTMLGAVRHQGFIPWDDDIDICMPREDYQVFAKVFPSGDGRYYTLDSRNSPYYYNTIYRACDGAMTLKVKNIAQIDHLGAFIDIFVQDRWPAGTEAFEARAVEIRRQVMNLRLALPAAYTRTMSTRQRLSRLYRLPKLLYYKFLVGFPRLRRELDALMECYNTRDTGWRMVSYENPRLALWYIREEDLDKRVLMPFEDIVVYAPENYDELLKGRYGDYMQLPPEDQRKPHHHFTAYWSEGYRD